MEIQGYVKGDVWSGDAAPHLGRDVKGYRTTLRKGCEGIEDHIRKGFDGIQDHI